MAGYRDEALSWDGDEDPTLDVAPASPPTRASASADVPPKNARTSETESDAPTATEDQAAAGPALPGGFTAVGKGSNEVGRVESDGSVTMPGDRPAMGNAALIATGVIGGTYLLYAIGWVIGGLRLSGVAGYLISSSDGEAPVMWQSGNLVGVWLAALAPVIWFLTVHVLTRGGRPWMRWVWLIAGVVLLVPWPLLMLGVSA